MATRLYSVSIGSGIPAPLVVEAVGSATVTTAMEATIDLGLVQNNGTAALARQDVYNALQRLRNHIVKAPWPPV